MCKRNSPQKNKACMGCARETSQIRIKPLRIDLNKIVVKTKGKRERERKQTQDV